MATKLDTFYGYLVKKDMTVNTETDEKLTVLRYFSNPKTYSYLKNLDLGNGTYLPLSLMELIFQNSMGIEEMVDPSNNYTDEYTRVWSGIWRILNDPDWLSITDGSQDRSYFTEIDFKTGGRVSFIYCSKSETGVFYPERKYVIFYELDTLLNEYVLQSNYYVFYDDIHQRNSIEREDVQSMLIKLLGEIGKTNIYTGVAHYLYYGNTCERVIENGKEVVKYAAEKITQDFYIFYVQQAPTEETMKVLIKEKLLLDFSDENGLNGRDNAAFVYPDLFDSEVRRVYILEENNFFPISYNILNAFMLTHPEISNPEVISMLQYDCPFVVENGVSDVIPAYHPLAYEGSDLTSDEKESNEFLYRLSSIANYINKLLSEPSFTNEAGYDETSEYIQFKFSFITWRVMKTK